MFKGPGEAQRHPEDESWLGGGNEVTADRAGGEAEGGSCQARGSDAGVQQPEPAHNEARAQVARARSKKHNGYIDGWTDSRSQNRMPCSSPRHVPIPIATRRHHDHRQAASDRTM